MRRLNAWKRDRQAAENANPDGAGDRVRAWIDAELARLDAVDPVPSPLVRGPRFAPVTWRGSTCARLVRAGFSGSGGSRNSLIPRT